VSPTKTKADEPAKAGEPPKTDEAARTDERTDARGVEDLTRTARQVVRSGRDLITDVGEILERELAMAVSISERLRDQTVSQQMLSEARSLRVQSSVRESAHHIVDLIADAVGVTTLTIARFGERLADEPRPPLHAREAQPAQAEPNA
jgi:hypothetical protein